MEKARLKRYLEKIKTVEERLVYVKEWLEEARLNEKSKFAVYKCFQEAIEGITDIFSMLLKDEKKIPKDDYTNFEELKKIKILDDNSKSTIIEANGLRNRLVHEYNGVDDKVALDSMEDLLPEIPKIIDMVKKWLEKRK